MILFTAAFTGTVLASDSCGVSIVQRLTAATHTIKEHTRPAHRHTVATLTKWEVWGNEYLAKHGHVYQPPKRKVVTTQPPDEDKRIFEFLCDLPPVPELAVWSDGLLDPVPAVETQPDMDEVAIDQIPPTVIPVLPPVGSEGFPPVLLTPIGGVPVPLVPRKPGTTTDTPTNGTTTPPVAVTPEPGSVVLLGTGLVAMWGVRRRSRMSMPAEV